MEVCIVGAFDV